MRRILHHGPTPTGTPVILDDRMIGSCWVELLRQGGCGDGEVVLQRDFHERGAIDIGDWISVESYDGARIYLGRIEECHFELPGFMRLRLTGMSIELNEVFPGGFQSSPTDQQPHRYGATDLFSNDPDRQWEREFSVDTLDQLVHLLIQQHVRDQTHIQYVPSKIEAPRIPLKALSLKFRGEESVRSIIKDLALRAQANWGVDAQGHFFFTQQRPTLLRTLRLGRDVLKWEEMRDREMLFNRLLLTGDYIYDKRDQSGQIARRVYRWRANYFEPTSCQRFGNRRLRLWIPWIRTEADALNFVREFFRLYAWPTPRHRIETTPDQPVIEPWNGALAIEDMEGNLLGSGITELVRIQLDQAVRMTLGIAPDDPRSQWPEPPQDERWELPDHIPSNGGSVSVTDLGSGGGGGGHSHSESHSSQNNPSTSDWDSSGSSGATSTQSSVDSSRSSLESHNGSFTSTQTQVITSSGISPSSSSNSTLSISSPGSTSQQESFSSEGNSHTDGTSRDSTESSDGMTSNETSNDFSTSLETSFGTSLSTSPTSSSQSSLSTADSSGFSSTAGTDDHTLSSDSRGTSSSEGASTGHTTTFHR